jgi:hypothetical protein
MPKATSDKDEGHPCQGSPGGVFYWRFLGMTTNIQLKRLPVLKKVCLHWSAGTLQASEFDRQFYHRLVDGEGKIVQGKFKPSANIPGPTGLRNGEYAAHCGGGNSYCIGWSLCGMAGFQSAAKPGKYLINQKQFEVMCEGVAKDCLDNDITVTPDTVFTHHEFGQRHPESESAGKIDIIYLPFAPDVKPQDVGDYIRNKIQWYISKQLGK